MPEPGRDETSEKKPAILDDRSGSAGGGSTSPGNPVMAKAPTPPEDQPKTESDKDKKEVVTADAVTAGKKDAELSKRKQGEERSRMDREAPMAASKVGPSRSGPVQNQSNQVNSGVSEMTVTRNVGGKSFHNRDGAWYDSAYHGQGTTNIGRGTEAYKKLVGGLRKIADKLGGVVVVVWKGKAYRIQ